MTSRKKTAKTTKMARVQDDKTLKTLIPYSGIKSNQYHINKEKENMSLPSQSCIDKYFPKNQHPICFSCRKSISNLNHLTNIEGIPIHQKCKQKIETREKQ